MRKFVVPLLVGTMLCIFLTSCSSIPKPPTETQIAKELPDGITTIVIENPFDYTNADVYKMNIEEVSIEKRQTNEKSDVVYCTVELSSEYYHFTKYVKLDYNYYDQGGWILDAWEYYNNTSYQILANPFSEDSAALKWAYEYSDVSLESTTLDTNQNSITYELQVENQHLYATIGGKLIDTYTFNGTQWTEYADASAIHTEWNIVGNWEYFEKDEKNSFVFGCALSIDSFDEGSASASGTCEFFYADMSPLTMQTSQRSYQNSLSDAKIVCSTDSIQIEWLMDSIQIDLDNASCEFYNGWGFRNKIPNLYKV